MCLWMPNKERPMHEHNNSIYQPHSRQNWCSLAGTVWFDLYYQWKDAKPMWVKSWIFQGLFLVGYMHIRYVFRNKFTTVIQHVNGRFMLVLIWISVNHIWLRIIINTIIWKWFQNHILHFLVQNATETIIFNFKWRVLL